MDSVYREGSRRKSASRAHATAQLRYRGMDRICTHCHAVLAPETQADWCPACGGALIERKRLSEELPHAVVEVDHRGIVLPRRHTLGGIITPQ